MKKKIFFLLLSAFFKYCWRFNSYYLAKSRFAFKYLYTIYKWRMVE